MQMKPNKIHKTAYNKLRKKPDKKYFCKAPFTALRFHRNGGVQICCHHIDFWYLSKNNLKDIWFGKELQNMRKNMKKYRIPEACGFCAAPYYSGDYTNVAALSFDYLAPNANGYPVLMDFSLENTCNLQCIMCDASLSSSIQKEKNYVAKPKEFIYNEDFLKQLDEFIPHLKHAVFTGGEPFLIHTYYGIWEHMISVNPGIQIHITTNGTVWNYKIEELLQKGKFHIMVSLDSFIKETYEAIRIGAQLDETLQHTEYFSGYCKNQGTVFTITICPLQINRHEIPDIVNYCNQSEWNFTYNIVLKPWEHALWSLPPDEIRKLIHSYEDAHIFGNTEIAQQNKQHYHSLISLLKTWEHKMRIFCETPQEQEQVENLKISIYEAIIQKAGQELDSTHINQERILKILDTMPEILIQPKFLHYVKNIRKEMLINELTENDNDTIAEHLCIVSFNL
jgi:molybdenum cofactor biosynthesis enzyme MoaA